ncbi:uncharacterized protein LOC121711731 [Alosa sapidissima]|uniref:uncharacterized protein LOC121711731 n=1 Tax=Alosa sapidissima TaxID=34773 RepID=UPI001C0A3D3C|nr:uncharacterized protein LOC121711731 [Alosa sapidissima]
MNGPDRVDMTLRPRVNTLTSPKLTAVVHANKTPDKQQEAVGEGLRHSKCVLNTSFLASHGGAGDVPAQKQSRAHVDEELSNRCDGVLIELYQLAMLQCQRYLHADNGLHRQVVGLGWGLLALLCKKNGVVSDNDIANLLLHKNLHSNGADACSAFDNLGKGTANLASLLIAGKTKEAIEQAMSQGAWHHALILNILERHGPSDCIMSRFVNNLDDSDLMKTYYQVRLGEMPSAAFACGEDSCQNWHLHLAIVVQLSKTNHLRKTSVTKMAETLASKGHKHGAQFCQMVLQLDREHLLEHSLYDVVGKWMGLLANMQNEVPQTRPEHPLDPEVDNGFAEVTNTLRVTSDQQKVPLSEELFKKVMGPLYVLQDHNALAEVEESTCKPQNRNRTKKKQSKKMSWFGFIGCFGSRTMD